MGHFQEQFTNQCCFYRYFELVEKLMALVLCLNFMLSFADLTLLLPSRCPLNLTIWRVFPLHMNFFSISFVVALRRVIHSRTSRAIYSTIAAWFHTQASSA